MNISDEALKPCPFCGGTNVKTFGPYGWYRQWGISHSCKSFYSGTSEMFQGFAVEADAIKAWNTRLSPPPSPADEELIAKVARVLDPACFSADPKALWESQSHPELRAERRARALAARTKARAVLESLSHLSPIPLEKGKNG